MSDLHNTAKRFWQSESGTTTTEYAVMSALIIVVAIASITLFSSDVKNVYDGVQDTIASTAGSSYYTTSAH